MKKYYIMSFILAVITVIFALLFLNDKGEDSVAGLWYIEEKGVLFQVENNSIVSYYNPYFQSVPTGDFSEEEVFTSLRKVDEQTLELQISAPDYPLVFRAVKMHEGSFPGRADDVFFNFDIFWKFCSENSGTALHWESVYTDYKALLQQNPSDEKLHHIVSEILSSIPEGHMVLYVPGDSSYYDEIQSEFGRVCILPNGWMLSL